MIMVAVNAHTGELAAFDRDSSVDPVDAVTASIALPGLVPTHSINGTRYISGGVRSPDNADLASDHANVVVLSPLGGRGPTPPEPGADPAGRFDGPAQTTGRPVIVSAASRGSQVGSHQRPIWSRTRLA